MKEQIHKSSGNIFNDLGFSNYESENLAIRKIKGVRVVLNQPNSPETE